MPVLLCAIKEIGDRVSRELGLSLTTSSSAAR
jgi:hypothetical protein